MIQGGGFIRHFSEEQIFRQCMTDGVIGGVAGGVLLGGIGLLAHQSYLSLSLGAIVGGTFGFVLGYRNSDFYGKEPGFMNINNP